jgi:hypothetical protein
MLECRPLYANRTVRGRKTLNSYLAFSLSQSGILMIAVALGAITGLFFFFRGFSLLQERRLVIRRSLSKGPAQSPTITATTSFTKAGDVPKRDLRAEVIQLSPADVQVGSESMTQQGKIAAALLKAGIPNPATWADQQNQIGVRLSDPPASEEAGAARTKDVELSRVLQEVNGTSSRLTALDQKPYSSPDWKANLMIWGGPILTLACIYTLAAHFGWL